MKFSIPFPVVQNKNSETALPFKKLWAFRAATYSTIVQLVASSIIILWYWKTLPPALPLWYSKPWGSERLTNPTHLFIMPITGVVLYIINMWIVRSMHHIHPIYARVLLVTSAVVSLLSFCIVVGIIRLVT